MRRLIIILLLFLAGCSYAQQGKDKIEILFHQLEFQPFDSVDIPIIDEFVTNIINDNQMNTGGVKYIHIMPGYISEKLWGYTDPPFDENLYIYINRYASKKMAPRILLHELVHAVQFMSGNLVYINGIEWIYRGENYNTIGLAHMKRPWEQEAYKVEQLVLEAWWVYRIATNQ